MKWDDTELGMMVELANDAGYGKIIDRRIDRWGTKLLTVWVDTAPVPVLLPPERVERLRSMSEVDRVCWKCGARTTEGHYIQIYPPASAASTLKIIHRWICRFHLI